LHIAAGADAANVVKLLIANGAKVNARNVWDQTPLHQAASEARSGVDVSNLLVDAGGELEVHDNKGFTALIVAAKHGNLALTRALLDRGANPNATTDNGNTVLDHAAKYPEVVQLLEARGGRRGAAAPAPSRPTVE
jgi:ankyrin repeat protein